MAASVKTHQPVGRRRRVRRHPPMSEINVTPFVDVMLVLLIIFMVTAPLLLSGLPVDLPPVKSNALSLDKELLTVTLDRSGKVYIGDSPEPVEVPQLVLKLAANAKGREDEQVLFRGDRKVEYGRVAEVMGAVRNGGFKKFTFVNGPEDIETRPKPR